MGIWTSFHCQLPYRVSFPQQWKLVQMPIAHALASLPENLPRTGFLPSPSQHIYGQRKTPPVQIYAQAGRIM